MGKFIFSTLLAPIAVIVYSFSIKGKLKNDPDKAKNFKAFGVLSLIASVLVVALLYPVVWLTIELLQLTFSYLGIFTQLLLLGNIVLFILAIELPILYLALVVSIIVLPICQLLVNRRAIGWISLVVAIIAIIAVLVLGVYLLSEGVITTLFMN